MIEVVSLEYITHAGLATLVTTIKNLRSQPYAKVDYIISSWTSIYGEAPLYIAYIEFIKEDKANG